MHAPLPSLVEHSVSAFSPSAAPDPAAAAATAAAAAADSDTTVNARRPRNTSMSLRDHRLHRHDAHRAMSDSESAHFDRTTGRRLCDDPLRPSTSAVLYSPPNNLCDDPLRPAPAAGFCSPPAQLCNGPLRPTTVLRPARQRPATPVTRSSYAALSQNPASTFLSMFAQKSTCSPPPDDEGQHIGPYILARQIGHGGFSIVREAVSALSPNTLVAVKIVRKPKISTDEDIKAHFDHEISIHKSLSHPNILPLLQVFDTPYATFAILKLSRSGTLYDLAKQHRSGLRPSLAKHYSYQLASALRYLHITARVVHRDVKLENCLLDSGQLLLCDFGMAEFLDSEKPDVDRIAGGSFPYASPEQIRSSQPLLSPAFDIWSFGVVLFALLTGELPFNHVFLPRLQMLILKGDWDKDKIIHTDAAQVVCGCLVLDPENRWDINTVLRDPWYQLV